ncbi:CatA-like O-acetyltransferase [Salegentibacter chungangensis]|uniref:CatA-like O-acetyltransferase n=1 Tax=Salegentibacter chungangensis TaxID=1335724 RepID=A0ABW3NVN2_9FLAO
MKKIDLSSWNRKEHFDFFSQYDDPFFGIVTEVDCTNAYRFARENKYSFFAWYLHKAITAVNKIEEFKYRILGEEVVLYDVVHAASTIGRKDGTFGFSFIHFSEDFDVFNTDLLEEIKNVENTTGLRANEDAARKDAIHFSTLPWNKFTGLTHAKNFNNKDSVPKISFGRAFDSGSGKKLPVAVNAHHGLMDGIHLARFLEEFQKLLNA